MFILMCAVDDSTGNKIWLKYSLVLDHRSHEDPENFPLYNINFLAPPTCSSVPWRFGRGCQT